MFSLIKQVFIGLLSFSSSLTRIAKVSDRTKCLSLNDEPRMVRPTLIDLNPIEFKYYPFMIGLDKCNGSCNVLSLKGFVPKKTTILKYFKVFNMLTNKNEARTTTKHISFDCKCKFSSATLIQIKNGIMKDVNVNIKNIVSAKKIIIGILAHVFVRI